MKVMMSVMPLSSYHRVRCENCHNFFSTTWMIRHISYWSELHQNFNHSSLDSINKKHKSRTKKNSISIIFINSQKSFGNECEFHFCFFTQPAHFQLKRFVFAGVSDNVHSIMQKLKEMEENDVLNIQVLNVSFIIQKWDRVETSMQIVMSRIYID